MLDALGIEKADRILYMDEDRDYDTYEIKKSTLRFGDGISYLKKNFKLPKAICDLQDVNSIELTSKDKHVKITSFPSCPKGSMPKLTNINLTNNKLKVFPNFSELKKLESIDLTKNDIKIIPETIKKLTTLKFLTLENNKIETIPDAIYELKDLAYLSLASNQIQDLPKGLDKLKKLSRISLSFNKLTEIPQDIYKLPSLIQIDIIGNPIDSYPNTINELSQMTDGYYVSTKPIWDQL